MTPNKVNIVLAYLHPLLLFDIPLVGLGLEAFTAIFLIFTDAFEVLLVVIPPVGPSRRPIKMYAKNV